MSLSDVSDVTMENESDEEKTAQGQENEENEQEAADVDGDDDTQQEEEHKDEESDEDEVQFVEEHEKSLQGEENNADGDIVDNGRASIQQRSRANTNALMAAEGHVTSATLEAELQCIICQYTMFKPVSAVCGHSYCRVCLLDSLLTRSIEEAQCPICRVDILQPFSAKLRLASVFSINVTLWNLVQLLIPSIRARISSFHQEEEQDFARKLDQLDAKWKILTLNERAARYHGDGEEEESRSSGRWREGQEERDEYPVLKVEDTHDGNLRISRNMVLDTNDENEDGYVNMRVGMAIVEFPSVFELYNEHQECSLNVIDEEMADGMPFFMSNEGDDDGLVCSSYYNEISLHVCDEAENCVMERTRGAQGGVVSFPGLRLDVPSGIYTFRFSDDLYGLKLSITTRLREPHEISDTPVADFVSLIHDEARDASHRNGTQHGSDSEREFDEESESDDSFIVDDLDAEEQPIGRFSDDEGGDHWENHSDDEAADELRERRRTKRRRQRSGRRSERDAQFVDEHEGERELSGEEEEHKNSDEQDNVDEDEEDDDDDDELRPGRRNDRVVENVISADRDVDQKEYDTVDGANETGKAQHYIHEVAHSRRRNTNRIVDSDDEEDAGGGAPISDEEQKDYDASVEFQSDHDDDSIDHDNANSSASLCIAAEDECGKEDDNAVRSPTRKVSRAQWCPDEEDKQLCPGTVSSPDQESETRDKRLRKRARQIQVMNEDESDEENEQMERSIILANTDTHDDADEEDDSDSHFEQVYLSNEESHDCDDALQDEENDYPDEEEADEEEQDDCY